MTFGDPQCSLHAALMSCNSCKGPACLQPQLKHCHVWDSISVLSHTDMKAALQVAIEVVPGVLRGLDRPEGVLTVRLIEAENVPKGGIFKWGDAYIV